MLDTDNAAELADEGTILVWEGVVGTASHFLTALTPRSEPSLDLGLGASLKSVDRAGLPLEVLAATVPRVVAPLLTTVPGRATPLDDRRV